MSTYQIDIQNSSGKVEIREYTMVSTSSLRSRTASLKYQKTILELQAINNGLDSSDDNANNFEIAIDVLNRHTVAVEELLRSILLGDWTNVVFDLIDEHIINKVRDDFFSSLLTQKTQA